MSLSNGTFRQQLPKRCVTFLLSRLRSRAINRRGLIKYAFYFCTVLIVHGCQNHYHRSASVTQELISESKLGVSLTESRVLPSAQLSPNDIQAAEEYIKAHNDYTAYHLLFALRRKSLEAYKRIPDSTKASILCSALAHLKYLNDWGYLDPAESYDREAAIALVEIGASALRFLEPLLDSQQPAPLFGSEEATLSSVYQYRRSDFAFRYASQILGLDPMFVREPKDRDKMIENLKNNELRSFRR